MAMLISKFHRLIQNKFIWAFFLLIVVFTFVIWGTKVPQQNRHLAEENAPGKLNGKPVDQATFKSAYMNTYLAVIMSMGRQISITPEIDEELHNAAWQRLVTLDEARKLGLTATDDEVFEAIKAHEGFQTQGQFNKAYYKAFVNNFLSQLGFTEPDFEQYIRQEILMQKIRIMVNRSVLVSPSEIQRTFNSISDKFKIEYVKLGPELVEKDVKVTREDAKSYYDKDPSAFTIPEKVKVKFVRISTVPLIPKVKIAPEDVQSYYDDHMDDFLAETNDLAKAKGANGTEAAAATNATATATAAATNEATVAWSTNQIATPAGTGAAELAAADTNDTFTPVKVDSKYKPFEAVKQEISNKLIQKEALDMASDKALQFVVELTSDKEGNAPKFEDVAATNGLLVEEAGPFSMSQKVKGIDAGLAFNRAAFALNTGQDTYFSDPVKGTNYVYVIAVQERAPERVPTFDEVADDALPIAKEQAIADALSTKAKEIRDAADAAVKAGKSFGEAVEKFGVTPITNAEFTAATGTGDKEYSPIVLRGILTMNQGEVSELLPAHDAVLVAHVIERKPGDPTTLESLRDQIISSIRRQNGRYVFDDLQQYLLKEAHFEAKVIPKNTDEDQEEQEPEKDTSTTNSAS